MLQISAIQNFMTMQENKQTKNFLIQGAFLAIAGIIVRIIGLAYRIPLVRIVGQSGMGYYAAAYNVYAVMLLLSSYSLPLAVSKMVAARISKGGYINANRILRASLLYATIVGGIGFSITFFGVEWFSVYLFHFPLSKYALSTLAPTIWIMAYLGVFRGYFQGYATMIPTATSQVLEQIINAIISIAAAWGLSAWALRASLSPDEVGAYGAAGGTIGTGVGALFALLLLIGLFFFLRSKRKVQMDKDTSSHIESYADITKTLFFTVVPVIASTAIYNINSIIDGSIFGASMDFFREKESVTTTMYGIYTGEYLTLVNVPVAISNALSSSLIPSLARSNATKDVGVLHQKITMALRFSTIISLPSAVGLSILAKPIIILLFGMHERIEVAISLLQLGSIVIVLYSISTISNAILQGTSHMRLPVKNAIFSLVIHIGFLLIFLYVFHMNIHALMIANIIFALCMCVFNAIDIKKYLTFRMDIKKIFILPLLSTAFMGIVTHVIYVWISFYTKNMFLLCIIPICFSVLTYTFAIIKTNTLTEGEIMQMPKGMALIRILKRIRIL